MKQFGGVMEMIYVFIVVVVTQFYIFVKTHQIGAFGYIKLYLNKVDF